MKDRSLVTITMPDETTRQGIARLPHEPIDGFFIHHPDHEDASFGIKNGDLKDQGAMIEVVDGREANFPLNDCGF